MPFSAVVLFAKVLASVRLDAKRDAASAPPKKRSGEKPPTKPKAAAKRKPATPRAP